MQTLQTSHAIVDQARVRRLTMPAEFALSRYSPVPDHDTAETNCPGGPTREDSAEHIPEE